MNSRRTLKIFKLFVSQSSNRVKVCRPRGGIKRSQCSAGQTNHGGSHGPPRGEFKNQARAASANPTSRPMKLIARASVSISLMI